MRAVLVPSSVQSHHQLVTQLDSFAPTTASLAIWRDKNKLSQGHKIPSNVKRKPPCNNTTQQKATFQCHVAATINQKADGGDVHAAATHSSFEGRPAIFDVEASTTLASPPPVPSFPVTEDAPCIPSPTRAGAAAADAPEEGEASAAAGGALTPDGIAIVETTGDAAEAAEAAAAAAAVGSTGVTVASAAAQFWVL